MENRMFGLEKKVTLTKAEWEEIQELFKQKEERINELEKTQAPQLMEIIKKQSATIEQLSKYKEQDDLLFNYENYTKELNQKVQRLEAEVEGLKTEVETYKHAFEKELNMSNLLAKKLVDMPTRIHKPCPEYEQVSILDLKA